MPFLRHLLHSGDGALRILLIVESHDGNIVSRIADFDPAGLVQPCGAGLHRTNVRRAPGCSWTAGHADEADLEFLVGRRAWNPASVAIASTDTAASAINWIAVRLVLIALPSRPVARGQVFAGDVARRKLSAQDSELSTIQCCFGYKYEAGRATRGRAVRRAHPRQASS